MVLASVGHISTMAVRRNWLQVCREGVLLSIAGQRVLQSPGLQRHSWLHGSSRILAPREMTAAVPAPPAGSTCPSCLLAGSALRQWHRGLRRGGGRISCSRLGRTVLSVPRPRCTTERGGFHNGHLGSAMMSDAHSTCLEHGPRSLMRTRVGGWA